ncbi:MAG: type II toxin-antitoxin system ParD family antitoxin [Planctomycetota bacterium]|jgi:antitoxin ParD1/3/4
MAKNTSISLGEHFDQFISTQIEAGRFSNASEVVRAGLRLLEEHEQRVQALRQALIDGEASGDAGPLNMQAIIDEARREVDAKPRPV